MFYGNPIGNFWGWDSMRSRRSVSTIEILGDAVGDVDWMSNMSIVDPVLWTFQNLAGLATPSCLHFRKRGKKPKKRGLKMQGG